MICLLMYPGFECPAWPCSCRKRAGRNEAPSILGCGIRRRFRRGERRRKAAQSLECFGDIEIGIGCKSHPMHVTQFIHLQDIAIRLLSDVGVCLHLIVIQLAIGALCSRSRGRKYRVCLQTMIHEKGIVAAIESGYRRQRSDFIQPLSRKR